MEKRTWVFLLLKSFLAYHKLKTLRQHAKQVLGENAVVGCILSRVFFLQRRNDEMWQKSYQSSGLIDGSTYQNVSLQFEMSQIVEICPTKVSLLWSLFTTLIYEIISSAKWISAGCMLATTRSRSVIFKAINFHDIPNEFW